MIYLIAGAVIFALGTVFGVVVTRYVIGLTTKLMVKSKDGAALDEDMAPDERIEKTI